MLLFIDLKVKLKMIFLSFSQNFELTFEKSSANNPYLLVVIGDFDIGIAKTIILLREFQLKI